MKNILVSACLLGENCRYDGTNKKDNFILSLEKAHTLIPICPEVLSGLGIPRVPCERQKDKIISLLKEDLTGYFTFGVEQALKLIQNEPIDFAILKEYSPSCGVNYRYSGDFNHTIIEGKGLLTEALDKVNIRVFSELMKDEIKEIL